MELYEIKNGLNKAHLLIEEFYRSIDIESYRREIEGLTIVTEQDNFWDDANKAKITYDKLNKMKKIVDQYDLLAATLNNLDETYELVKSSEEVEFLEILESDYLKFQEDLDKLCEVYDWYIEVKDNKALRPKKLSNKKDIVIEDENIKDIKSVNVRVDKGTWEEFERLCSNSSYSKKEIITQAIKDFMKAYKSLL